MHLHTEMQAMSAEQLGEIIAQAPVGICAVSVPSLTIVVANDEYAALDDAGSARSLIGVRADDRPPNSLTARLLGCWEAAARTGEPLTVDENRVAAAGTFRDLEVRSVPLKHPDGSVCAVMSTVLDVTERTQAQTELDVRMQQQAVVAELGQNALSEGDVGALMAAAASCVADTLGTEYCEVLELLPDRRELLLRAGVGWHEGAVGTERVGAGADSQAGYTLLSEGPVVVTDLPRETRFVPPELLIRHGVVSGVTVVIPGPERPFGILGAHTAGHRAFSEDDAHFLELIANVVGAAIDRAQVEGALRDARRQAEDAYERERRIANEFQRALLPCADVQMPGYAIAHTYRPALIEADVGGDFYNLFLVDERHLAVVAGDIGGKGLDAAVLAAQAQHAIYALVLGAGHTPASVLEAVRRVAISADPDRLLTVFLGILDTDTGRLSYASAGHEPALIWRNASEGIERMLPTGPAVFGLADDAIGEEQTVLDAGDLFFVYTDGLPDARRPHGSGSLGEAGIREQILRLRGRPPEDILGALYRAAWEQSGGHLRDDIAMVAMRRLDSSGAPGTSVFVAPPEMAQRLSLKRGA